MAPLNTLGRVSPTVRSWCPRRTSTDAVSLGDTKNVNISALALVLESRSIASELFSGCGRDHSAVEFRLPKYVLLE